MHEHVMDSQTGKALSPPIFSLLFQNRATYSAEGVPVEESIKTPLETQVEDSAKELERLLLEGRELVSDFFLSTNIRRGGRISL